MRHSWYHFRQSSLTSKFLFLSTLSWKFSSFVEILVNIRSVFRPFQNSSYKFTLNLSYRLSLSLFLIKCYPYFYFYPDYLSTISLDSFFLWNPFIFSILFFIIHSIYLSIHPFVLCNLTGEGASHADEMIYMDR